MTLKIQLELDEAQENFLVLAVMDAATTAWHNAVAGEVDGETHTEDCKTFWQEQLAAAEGVLGQFSAEVMSSWRHMLSHYGPADPPSDEDPFDFVDEPDEVRP